MERNFLKNYKVGSNIEIPLMINKILSKDNESIVGYFGDKTGDIKGIIKFNNEDLKLGDIILVKGILRDPFKAKFIKKIKNTDIFNFLPSGDIPIEEVLSELDRISKEEFKSPEIIALNDYFFKDDKILTMFKIAIGGVYNHHNYLGGLAEHTLGVMYLAKVLSYRYKCAYKEIAILGAKLHDIGKIYEMNYNGPFSYTLRGEMEGHIVIGINMVEEAFKKNPSLYSEEFRERIKGVIVQHHGKEEYGSPKAPKSHESYIVHFADYVDATLNKISIISKGREKGTWTEYQKRLETKLFL